VNINSSIRLKSGDDIKRIAEAGKVIAGIFSHLAGISLEGMSTLELDSLVESRIQKFKARPSFKTVPSYFHATCISVNDEVVHGVPQKKKKIKIGDIVKVDVGVVKNGYFADACSTFPVGKVPDKAKRLMEVTRKSLFLGIGEARAGKRLGDIGYVIQQFVEGYGYGVVRDFTGHGVGYAVHEQPNVPHYGRKNSGMVLREGLVIAIEPMINEGTEKVITLEDGWTTVTADGKLSAQFEHTVAITSDGPCILTE